MNDTSNKAAEVEKIIDDFKKTVWYDRLKLSDCITLEGQEREELAETLTIWLRATLYDYRQSIEAEAKERGAREERERIKEWVKNKAGKVFGYDVVVVEELDNEYELRGYKRAVEDIKRQLIRELTSDKK